MNPQILGLSFGTKNFVNNILYHTGLRYGKNTEKLREKKLLHKLFKVTRRIRITIEEKGPFKVVIHMSDLAQLFPEVVFCNL